MTNTPQHHPSASNWEEQLRTQLQHHEAEAPADLWESIEHDLAAAEVKEGRVVPIVAKWASAAAVAAVVSGAGFWALQINDNTKPIAEVSIPTEKGQTPTKTVPAITAEHKEKDTENNSKDVQHNSNFIEEIPNHIKLYSKDTEDNSGDSLLQQNKEEYIVFADSIAASEALTQGPSDPNRLCLNENSALQITDTIHRSAIADDKYYYVQNRAEDDDKETFDKPQRHRFSFAFQAGQGSHVSLAYLLDYDEDLFVPGDDSAAGDNTENPMKPDDADKNNPDDSKGSSSDNDEAAARSTFTHLPQKVQGQLNQNKYRLIYSNHDFPIKAAALFRLNFTKRIALDAGFAYTYLRSSFRCAITDPKCDWSGEQRVHYLGIPVTLSYSLVQSRHWNLYLSAGGEVAKAVSVDWRRNNTKGSLTKDQNSLTKEQHSEAPAHPWQCSLSIAAGVQYKLTRYMGIYLQPSADYYFDNHSCVKTYYSKHPFTPSIHVGLRFNVSSRP